MLNKKISLSFFHLLIPFISGSQLFKDSFSCRLLNDFNIFRLRQSLNHNTPYSVVFFVDFLLGWCMNFSIFHHPNTINSQVNSILKYISLIIIKSNGVSIHFALPPPKLNGITTEWWWFRRIMTFLKSIIVIRNSRRKHDIQVNFSGSIHCTMIKCLA